jgi:hypothetical protein
VQPPGGVGNLWVVSDDLDKPFASRRAWRRANRRVRETRERLVELCQHHGCEYVLWETIQRDPTYGFTTAMRWHGIVFSRQTGDLLASDWDVLPADRDAIGLRLLNQLEERFSDEPTDARP